MLALERMVLNEGRFFVRTADEAPDLASMDRSIADYLQSENAVMLAARVDGAVVGVIRMTGGALKRTRHSAKLEVLVHPSYRGKGHGRDLMAAGLAWARSTPQVQRVALCVFADNIDALAMYERLGFVEEGRRIGEYREADGTLRDDVMLALSV